MKLRVAVLFGGISAEHGVSISSARSIIAGLKSEKYEVVPVGITKRGQWLCGGDAMRRLTEEAEAPRASSPRGARHALINSITLPDVDIVFPALHGLGGEDGTVQGLLETAGLPYVGAGVAASALGMDKALMKAVFRQCGLLVTDYLVVEARDVPRHADLIARQVEERIGLPCFAKPANGGSSLGVSKVSESKELKAALLLASRYDRKLLVERAVLGRELECAVLGNDEPQASCVGEVIPRRSFYDYEAKYIDPETRFAVPADIEPEVAAEIRRLSLLAFKAIDCAGMARVDFLQRRSDGAVFLNEINTIPGFTAVSMYPKLWEASGLPFAKLLDRLIEMGMERHAARQKVRFGPGRQRRRRRQPILLREQVGKDDDK